MKYLLSIILFFAVNYGFGQVKIMNSKRNPIPTNGLRIIHESKDYLYLAHVDPVFLSKFISAIDKKTLELVNKTEIKYGKYFTFCEDNVITSKLNLLKGKCGAQVIKKSLLTKSQKEHFFPCPDGFDYNFSSGTAITSSENGKFHLLRFEDRAKLGYRFHNVLVDENLNEIKSFVNYDENGKLIESFVDNDGSIYFLKSNFKLICYNALKEFEMWEQIIQFEGELNGAGTFYGLSTESKGESMTFHTKFFTEDKEFWVTMPINYYSKEIEGLVVKEVPFISPEKKGYVEIVDSITTFFEKSENSKYRFVGSNLVETSYSITFYNDERDSVKTRKYGQRVKGGGYFAGVGYEIDSTNLLVLFNVNSKEVEEGLSAKTISDMDSLNLQKNITDTSPVTSIYQIIDRKSGNAVMSDFFLTTEQAKKAKIDPRTLLKSKYNGEYFILGYKIGFNSSYSRSSTIFKFKL